jgi:hypothetical protein
LRKDYQPGVLAPSQKSASELAAREAFNREHPPIEGLCVPHDLRKMERHPVQISPEEAAELLAASHKAAGGR